MLRKFSRIILLFVLIICTVLLLAFFPKNISSTSDSSGSEHVYSLGFQYAWLKVDRTIVLNCNDLRPGSDCIGPATYTHVTEDEVLLLKDIPLWALTALIVTALRMTIVYRGGHLKQR